MQINPLRYLVSPKITAAIISFPLLTAMFDLIGIAGGYISGVLLLGLNPGVYSHSVQAYVVMSDITNGIVKAIVCGDCFHCLLLPGLFCAHAQG